MVAASPTTASAPAQVTLSGTGFDPLGGTVSCDFTSGTPASSSTLTLGHTGIVTGSIQLTSNDAVGLNPIVCSQTSHADLILTVTVTFTVTTLSDTCGPGTGPTCTVGQVVGTTVSGTDLTLNDVRNTTPNATGGVNPTNADVVFSMVTLGNQNTDPACLDPDATQICSTGAFVAADGHLNSVVVDDNRGDLGGWTVTGQLASAFEGPDVGDNHAIPADLLTWVPSVSTASTSCVTLDTAKACGPSDVITQITAGPAHTLSTTTSAVLCQAAPGGGGGGTKCTAELLLAVPPYIAAGQYTATIDIVVS